MMLTGTGLHQKTASTEWAYSINYGPEGEENYANLLAPGGVYVSNIHTHHAKEISQGMNALAAKDAEIARLREALAECEEHFDNIADADHDQDGFIPNKEMQLLVMVRASLKGSPL